jgi:hypothetical protein
MLRYTADAKELLDSFKNFDLIKFEDWIYNFNILIGGNHILTYIKEKEKWNNRCLPNYSKPLKTSFSNQSRNIISQFPSFDIEECVIWFNNSVEMAKADILNYLETLKYDNVKKDNQ